MGTGSVESLRSCHGQTECISNQTSSTPTLGTSRGDLATVLCLLFTGLQDGTNGRCEIRDAATSDLAGRGGQGFKLLDTETPDFMLKGYLSADTTQNIAEGSFQAHTALPSIVGQAQYAINFLGPHQGLCSILTNGSLRCLELDAIRSHDSLPLGPAGGGRVVYKWSGYAQLTSTWQSHRQPIT
ncbi:hypothetical protein VTK26DRAFT_4332 [Humicola hyalothermophila]